MMSKAQQSRVEHTPKTGWSSDDTQPQPVTYAGQQHQLVTKCRDGNGRHTTNVTVTISPVPAFACPLHKGLFMPKILAPYLSWRPLTTHPGTAR